MGNYAKQTWKDAIVNESGNVIEAGTLITKERMEHIEQGVEDAGKASNTSITNIQAEALGIIDDTKKNVEGALAKVNENIGNVDDTTTTPVELRGKDIVTRVNEVFTSASNGKTLIANAITGKGVDTSPTATYQQMAYNIGFLRIAPLKNIYHNGVEETATTGGLRPQRWNVVSKGLMSVTKQVTNLDCYFNITHGQGGFITNNKVDLTDVIKIIMTSSITAPVYRQIQLYDYNPVDGALYSPSPAPVAESYDSTYTLPSKTIKLDVSNLIGAYYIWCGTYVSNAVADTHMHMTDISFEYEIIKTYLYNEGNEYTSLTGGWGIGFGYGSGSTIVENAANITVTTPYNASTAWGVAETDVAVSFAGYTKLKCTLNVLQNNGAIVLKAYTSANSSSATVAFSTSSSKPLLGVVTYEVDITSAQSSYYVGICGQSHSSYPGTIQFEINKVWLE